MDNKEIEAGIWKTLYAESNKFCKSRFSGKNERSYQCSAINCTRKAYASGLCNAHYIRKRQGRTFDIPIKNRKLQTDACLDCNEKLDKHGCGLSRCPKHFKSFRTSIIKKAIVILFGERCSVCKKQYADCVYDFHHHNGNKDYGVGVLLTVGSVKRIALEASKCIMVCANCHREIHYG